MRSVEKKEGAGDSFWLAMDLRTAKVISPKMEISLAPFETGRQKSPFS